LENHQHVKGISVTIRGIFEEFLACHHKTKRIKLLNLPGAFNYKIKNGEKVCEKSNDSKKENNWTLYTIRKPKIKKMNCYTKSFV